MLVCTCCVLVRPRVVAMIKQLPALTAWLQRSRRVLLPVLPLKGVEYGIILVAGEKVWRLPLEDTYMENLSSPIADLKNTGIQNRYGGAITASLFLREFVDTKKVGAHAFCVNLGRPMCLAYSNAGWC